VIERYTRPEMASIWSDTNRFKIWLEVELSAAEAMAECGLVSKEDVLECRKKAKFNENRIKEVEKEAKHDVIAFLTSVNESIGKASRCIHFGMTSSDLIDTSFALQLTQSGRLLLDGLDKLRLTLRKRATELKAMPCIGRSHGIHAEPMTLGLKILNWYAEASRARIRLENAINEVATCTISGAVGTYSSLPPKVEEILARKLGLSPEPIATQVIPRDRHAAFFNTLALIGAGIERWATEIRHLQRTEVREVEEPFSSGQKGSSAMPHKKNPILCENLTGLARLLRSYALSSYENVALWHERDISHSSVERVIAPDACTLLDFMIHRFSGVVEGLRVLEENVLGNLKRTRKLYASGSLLVALTDSGMLREDAYKIVQEHALAAWDSEPDLEARVRADDRIKLSNLDELFSIDKHLEHVDSIFERVFSVYP